MPNAKLLAALAGGAALIAYSRYKAKISRTAVSYIVATINTDPFASWPATSKPELSSATTLPFFLGPNNQIVVLGGQQNAKKAGADNASFNVVDLSGGRREKTDESSVATANRELAEEMGITGGTLLPKAIYKVYVEDGKPKAKVVFLRYLGPVAAYELFLNDFVRRSTTVIQQYANKFELTRFMLLPNFFEEIATVRDPEHPEMPRLTVAHVSDWFTAADRVERDSNVEFKARKAVTRIYSNEMCQLVRNEITTFIAANQMTLKEITMPFPIADVPADLDINTFTQAPKDTYKGSNPFSIGRGEDGRYYVAKGMDPKFGPGAYHTILAEELTRRFYTAVHVNVVPGRILVDSSGKPYYVMPDMVNNYPEAAFAPGPFDDQIAKIIPDLYDNEVIVREMQAGMLVALYCGNYDDIFKNRLWRRNSDSSITMLLSDFGGTHGSKAGGKISGLLPIISPLELFILMTQPATLTCSNEPFNRVMDYATLQEMTVADVSKHYAILKSAVRNVDVLDTLAQQFEATFTTEFIATQTHDAYAQLGQQRSFTAEIEWRAKTLADDIKKSEEEYEQARALTQDASKKDAYDQAKLFVKANKSALDATLNKSEADRTDDETIFLKAIEASKKTIKEFEKANMTVAKYPTNRGLLSLAEQTLAEMTKYCQANPNSTVADWHLYTLLQRKNSLLALVNTLVKDIRADQAQQMSSANRARCTA